MSRIDFSLLVLDLIRPGLPFSSHMFACIGLSSPVFGLARLGFSSSMLDLLHFDSALLLRSHVRLGFLSSVLCLARLDFPLLILDHAHLGSTISLQAYVQAGLTPSTYGCFAVWLFDVHLGFHPLRPDVITKSHGAGRKFHVSLWFHMSWTQFAVVGPSKFWKLYALKAHCCVGSVLPVYGLARIESILLVLDLAHSGFILSSRSYCRSESPMLVFGIMRIELTFSVLDLIHLDSFLFLRSFAHFDLVALIYGLCRLGLNSLNSGPFPFWPSTIAALFPSRRFLLLVYGMSRPDFMLLVSDFVNIGLSPSLHSFVRLGSPPLVFGVGLFGISTSNWLCSSWILIVITKLYVLRFHAASVLACLLRVSPVFVGLLQHRQPIINAKFRTHWKLSIGLWTSTTWPRFIDFGPHIFWLLIIFT